MTDYFYEGPSNTLTDVAKALSQQAKDANAGVKAKLDQLKASPDDTALLADLQHSINKWSVVFNISSTVQRAIKDNISSILQKM